MNIRIDDMPINPAPPADRAKAAIAFTNRKSIKFSISSKTWSSTVSQNAAKHEINNRSNIRPEYTTFLVELSTP